MAHEDLKSLIGGVGAAPKVIAHTAIHRNPVAAQIVQQQQAPPPPPPPPPAPKVIAQSSAAVRELVRENSPPPPPPPPAPKVIAQSSAAVRELVRENSPPPPPSAAAPKVIAQSSAAMRELVRENSPPPDDDLAAKLFGRMGGGGGQAPQPPAPPPPPPTNVFAAPADASPQSTYDASSQPSYGGGDATSQPHSYGGDGSSLAPLADATSSQQPTYYRGGDGATSANAQALLETIASDAPQGGAIDSSFFDRQNNFAQVAPFQTQQQQPRARAQNTGNNMSRAFQRLERRIYCPVNAPADVAAASTVAFTVKPSVSFQPDTIVCGTTVAADFNLVSWSINMQPQQAAVGEVSMELFIPNSTQHYMFDVANEGNEINFTVRNKNVAAKPFTAALIGHQVAVSGG